jgi:hypothetical protein
MKLTLRQVLHECLGHILESGREPNASVWLKVTSDLLCPLLTKFPVPTVKNGYMFDRDELVDELIQIGSDINDAFARVDSLKPQILLVTTKTEALELLFNSPKIH